MGPMHEQPTSPEDLAALLASTGYLADDGLATAGYLALRLGRPLFLEGDAGVGKTAFASALAQATGAHFVRLQCYEGLDATQALYDWDFPRQILHLRAAEAAARAAGSAAGTAGAAGAAGAAGTAAGTAGAAGAAGTDGAGGARIDADTLEAGLYDRRFLIARPLLRALERSPTVLLVDEVDRADDEFEAFLLEVLADAAVTIPELGRIAAETPPLTVLTSNRTREVHDALKRRCLYHWVEHPDVDREVAILRSRLPEVTDRLATQVATAAKRMRELDLIKPPGVAESLDWAGALITLGSPDLTAGTAAATLGAVLKYREDTDRVRAAGLATLLEP